jgi:hypothetical protein
MDEQYQPQQAPAPQTQDGSKSWEEITGRNTAPRRGRGLRRLLLIIPIAVLAVGLWYGIGRYEKYSKAHRFESKISNDPSIGKIPPAYAAVADTPLGHMVAGSGSAAGVSVGVDSVSDDPATTGDDPSAGMRYIAVYMNVISDSKSLATVSGTFYYRTGSGELLPTATSTGKQGEYPNKKVELAGRDSLEDLSLNPGQSDNSHYLLYQIPKDDTGGKLIWYEDYYDTSSTKLAVFDLN